MGANERKKNVGLKPHALEGGGAQYSRGCLVAGWLASSTTGVQCHPAFVDRDKVICGGAWGMGTCVGGARHWAAPATGATI